MAKRSSAGSSGRRGTSRTNSGGRFSGRKSSSDKPFKKSTSKDSGRSSSFDKGPRGSFRKKDDSADSRSGQSRPFKKSDKPFGRRDEGSSETRGRSYGDKKAGFSSRSKGSSEDSFKKSDRPFRKRSSDSSGSSERTSERTYGNRRGSFSKESRSSDRSDKPFRSRRTESSESGDKAYGSKRGSFARDKGENSNFKKTDRPFNPRKKEGSSESRGAGGSGDKSKRTSSFGLPYKRSYEKKGGRSSDEIEKKSSEDLPKDVGQSRGRGRRDKSDNDLKGFSKRSKSRDEKSADQASPAQTNQIRLNRYIANSGVCSRREADELIAMGLVSVNGKTITEMGYKVNPGDEVRYESKVLTAEKPVYILLNKPKGYLTTTNDPQERKTVMHILGGAVKARIYPVGRLDRNTTGLLLLTNDGDLADKLMHPSYNVKKIYKVELDKPITRADLQLISEGVMLEEGRATVDDVAIVSDDGKTVGVEIHIGWNRVIRRIFEKLGYEVVRLDRSVYAGLDKKDLGRGEWRHLTKEEIVRLKHYN